MSRTEARRRLQEADPNLKIVYGRRLPHTLRDRIPKLLSDEEAKWFGVGEMVPIIVSAENHAIQAKWSKSKLQGLCWDFGIDPRGLAKYALVDILTWANILDRYGNRTDKQPRPRS